jgi:tRNA A-37 threonylcarbamoyl transferase component Bud32
MYPQVFGKYVLERELARGGMARVMLATLRGAGGFEKRLVVKQIRDDLACDEDFVRRFVEEAKTTVALAHPNIVPVYELGVELGTYFLAMEYVEGVSLAELLRACAAGGEPRRGLSPEEGAYVGVEVCRALDYAHRRMNVVHRDVTPRNVMVDDEGQVKVIDFGISAPVATAPTGQGVFGSPGHMPPEQMEGKELTPAADVFAAAVLLMELWSGKPPFRRRTTEEIEAAMRGPHPKPSEADIRLLPLDDVIASAMALDPKARPQQADDLARALRRFLMGVDLGDVARRLGDRVRAARAHPPPPSSEQKPVLQRPPSRPTATQVGTKTFAAREEVVEWKEAGTRKLVSSRPAPAKDVETVATRPLETDRGKEGSAAARRRSLTGLGIAGAAVLTVAAFLLGKIASPGRAAAPGATAARTATTANPPSIVPSKEAAPAPAPASASAPAPAPAPASASASASALDSRDHAILTLLGDGTTVTVDGVPRGHAPAKVAVDPGPHTILFTFPATGESKSESLSLRSGDRATLRADFTGATPSIRVQR